MTINITVSSYEELEEFCRQFLAGQDSRGQTENKATEPVNPAPIIPDPEPVKTEPVKPEPVKAEEPVLLTPSQVTYTRDDLTRAAVSLIDSGKKADLQALLEKFGVSALPSLPKDHYVAFAGELKALGATL